MIVEIVVSVFLIAGSFFIFVAGIGILKMPDIFLRMHAATKATSLGIMLILFGVMILYPTAAVIVKSFIIIVFLYLTTPVAASLLGKTLLDMGISFWRKNTKETDIEK
jgi:multicomponent Na+:H+ antiporter subunit G